MSNTNTLTLEDIQDLLSTTRQRGIYEVVASRFAKTGEMALNVSELPEFKGKEVNSVRNSFKNNLEKVKDAKLTVLIDRTDKNNHKVILVNMDAVAAARSAQAAQ